MSLPPLRIFSVSVRLLLFLSLIVPILTWNVPLISPVFLKTSLVFPTLLFSSISLHCLFKKAFLSLLAILWTPVLSWVYLSFSPLPFTSLFFSAIVKPPQETTLPSCVSLSLGWFWSPHPVQCYELLPIVLQTLCLPDLIIPWIYSSPPLYNQKGFYLGHTWVA